MPMRKGPRWELLGIEWSYDRQRVRGQPLKGSSAFRGGLRVRDEGAAGSRG